MPIGGFHWLKKREIVAIDWSSIDLYGDEGYIVECSLHYPEHLHEQHASYPLAVESRTITHDMLSPYAKECHEILKGNNVEYKSKKLTATFHDRDRYVLHFACLQLYTQLGMKIKRIHRVIAFRQTRFLKVFIDYCTQKRASSTSPFEKNVWKLTSNSTYGKTIENVRNYMQCSFLRSASHCGKKISESNFDHFKIVSENFVLTFSKYKSVLLNKPYAVGFSTLEWSKYFMYKAYYFDIAPRFHAVKVLFSDTDSFLLSVKLEGKSEEEKEEPCLVLNDFMDFSNYPKDSPLHDSRRENQLGFFKNETKGRKIESFVGLKSKTYAMKLKGDHAAAADECVEKNVLRRTKGITKGYRSTLSFETFRRCLQEVREERVIQYQIQAKNHSLRTMKVSKIAFSSFCDKRYIMKECAIHSVPYGSNMLKKYSSVGCAYCEKILF